MNALSYQSEQFSKSHAMWLGSDRMINATPRTSNEYGMGVLG